MKYILTFIIIILGKVIFAQAHLFPDAVANTYTLTEKEGYNGFIYSSMEFGEDGTIYTCDYSGNIEIHGNNYYTKVEGAKNEGVISYFKIISKTEAWGIGLKSIIIIKN